MSKIKVILGGEEFTFNLKGTLDEQKLKSDMENAASVLNQELKNNCNLKIEKRAILIAFNFIYKYMVSKDNNQNTYKILENIISDLDQITNN